MGRRCKIIRFKQKRSRAISHHKRNRFRGVGFGEVIFGMGLNDDTDNRQRVFVQKSQQDTIG
jgi:hypothetical protein